jgi:carbonic anhydrase
MKQTSDAYPKPDQPTSAHQVPPGCRPVQAIEDILPAYRGTPVEEFLAYHNLGTPFKQHPNPELLIGTCMDFRILLRIPRDFAYVLRVGGANLRGLEFHVSLAVASGVKAICLMGHDQCAMSRVVDRDQAFVSGLVEHAGWGEHEAQIHFETYSSRFAIGDEIDFVRSEAARLNRYYPRMLVAPLFYCVQERVIHQIFISEPK